MKCGTIRVVSFDPNIIENGRMIHTDCVTAYAQQQGPGHKNVLRSLFLWNYDCLRQSATGAPGLTFVRLEFVRKADKISSRVNSRNGLSAMNKKRKESGIRGKKEGSSMTADGGLFLYEKIGEEIRLVKWTGEIPHVSVPEQVDGKPVTSLDAYAFSGGRYESIALPGTIRTIGRYAFYNCHHLKSFSFYTSMEDVGAGAFTGCRNVERLEVTEQPVPEGRRRRRSCFRDVLSEFSGEISVVYHGEGEARLMFPEFYEEGVENTPARIIMTEVHGTGLYYRNSFLDGQLNFREYDSRFYAARAQESERFLIRLCLGRLLWPYKLETAYRKEYQDYLREHLEYAGRYLAETKDLSGLRYLADIAEDRIGTLLDMAQKAGWAEGVGYLMELRRVTRPARRTIFEL